MNQLIIRNGRIYAGHPAIETTGDLLVENGRIARIGTIPVEHHAREIDAGGNPVLPGVVDPHAHFICGDNAGYHMLLKAGVTTALDPIVGPDENSLLQYIENTPAGLNILYLVLLKPGWTIKDTDPSQSELEKAIAQAMAMNAFGVKIAGAHFPLTTDATARTIEIAARMRVPLMIHAGSAINTDDFAGMAEIIHLASGKPFILAHADAYCQNAGETLDAINLLKINPAIVSESTLSPLNCIGTRMIDDIPESMVMLNILKELHYSPDYHGMKNAVADGALMVSGPCEEKFRFLPKEAGLAHFIEHHGAVTVGYNKHNMAEKILMASAGNDQGKFVVNAFSSDGGVIPRNVILDHGLALVQCGVFSLTDFVRKASYNGACLLGLENSKGHLSPGADADLIIVDELRREPITVISGGHIVLHENRFFPRPNKIYPLCRNTPAWL